MMLIAMQYDIELQEQFMYQHRLYLHKAVGSYLNMHSDYEPNSKAERGLQAKIAQLNEAEKIIEMKLKQLQNRKDAVSKERTMLERVIKSNIAQSFSNAYGGGR